MLPVPAATRPLWSHPQLARSQPARSRPPAVYVDPTATHQPSLRSPAQQPAQAALAAHDPNAAVKKEAPNKGGRSARVVLAPNHAVIATSPAAVRPSKTATPGQAAPAMLRPATPTPASPLPMQRGTPCGQRAAVVTACCEREVGPSPYERPAKRPCLAHAPAASPGRTLRAPPLSPAMPIGAAPSLGERRTARPFSPAPQRPPSSPAVVSTAGSAPVLPPPQQAAAEAAVMGQLLQMAQQLLNPPPAPPLPPRAAPPPQGMATEGEPTQRQPCGGREGTATPRRWAGPMAAVIASPAATPGAAGGANGSKETARRSKRPCLAHAPAAQPAPPLSLAMPTGAAPSLGVRRAARPFSPAPARPTTMAPPSAPPPPRPV